MNQNTATLKDPIWDSRNSDEPMPALPGQNLPNTPPLPNVIPDTVHPQVPASWDTVENVSAAVFALLRKEGKPAADALLAWIEARRNK